MNNKTIFIIITLILIFISMNLSIAQKIVLLPPTSHGEYLNGTKYKGNTITFTGSRSHDNDSYVGEFTPEWKWDFDYGGTFVPDITTTNSTVNHKYTMAGVYRVGVRYFDDDGEAGSVYTFEITIAGHNRYYYVKDHLGSIRVTIDDQGEVASAQDYYAYGEIIADRSYNSSSPNEKYKFTEKERDTETNYDYFGARYYDSEIGRWLAVDALTDAYPGLSPYNYSANNPLNNYDSDGRAIKRNGEYIDGTEAAGLARIAMIDAFRGVGTIDFYSQTKTFADQWQDIKDSWGGSTYSHCSFVNVLAVTVGDKLEVNNPRGGQSNFNDKRIFEVSNLAREGIKYESYIFNGRTADGKNVWQVIFKTIKSKKDGMYFYATTEQLLAVLDEAGGREELAKKVVNSDTKWNKKHEEWERKSNSSKALNSYQNSSVRKPNTARNGSMYYDPN